jgi:putative restriction endonuclease
MDEDEADRDTLVRTAAFDHVRRLGEVHDHLTATELKPGFVLAGERIPLINPQRGIFKPQQMRFLLSIKTVFPKPGGKVWYDDQREVHRQIFEGDETIDYAFMGQDPNAADNRWLREAYENRIPIIYFLGIAPGRYQAMLPSFISGWDGNALKARVAFGAPDQETLTPPETALERRYALRAVKERLHQASFREAVITAYNGRCALSGLPESLLLDAAHIVADKDEQFGQPVVPNGIRSRKFITPRSMAI